MNKRITALVIGAVVAGLTLLTVQLVSAHNHPVLFDPAPAAVLEEAPAEVTAWFAGPVRRDANWTYLQVVDADGNRVDTGELNISEDRRQMSIALEADLGPGVYMVTWRNWDDDDGFIMGDCYRFYVGQEAADTAISEGNRLFGGEGCEDIGISAREGTPTPEELTPTVESGHGEGTGATGSTGGTGEQPEASDDDDSDGVPVWTLALAAIGGLVIGGVGMKLAGPRA
jgi:methionine-rich copper-binding protein CopC